MVNVKNVCKHTESILRILNTLERRSRIEEQQRKYRDAISSVNKIIKAAKFEVQLLRDYDADDTMNSEDVRFELKEIAKNIYFIISLEENKRCLEKLDKCLKYIEIISIEC